jgi:hypothetical protein
MNKTTDTEQQSTRGKFLRRLATFAGVGLGVALVPSVARAQSGRCCPQDCTESCGPGEREYACDGCGSNCCKCLPDSFPNQCFNVACPCG